VGEGEKEYLGSLLMVSPEAAPPEKRLPLDEHGFPYQVILLLHPGGHGTKGLKLDGEGRVLGPVMTPEGQPTAEMRPVPAEVAEAALAWWADYQRDPKRHC
jgi:hypothetical protein